MEANGDIFVLPFFGQGHLFPAMELCTNLSTHNYNITLIIPSHLSPSIPSTFSDHIHVKQIPSGSGSGSESEGNPLHEQNAIMGEGIKSFVSGSRPVCVIVDVMMSWSKDIFVNLHIPVVSFSTSGATSSAIEYGKWKANVGDMKSGEVREIPGLPSDMRLITFSDLNADRSRRPQKPAGLKNRVRYGPRTGGPLKPGDKPRWVDEIDGSVALLINTCDNLERPFTDYIADQTKLPVWGVGPLLPVQFWKSAGSILHDHEMRSNHKSNYTEDEVIQWLESKPRGSVIYISFGSEVGPTIEEYQELAKALEELNRAFIWVIQPGSGKTKIPGFFLEPEDQDPEGYYPDGLAAKAGDRGLIISGWAPQLMILSHPSTGGFLSHCGWNSTVESIGRGVSILGWPIRGDQFNNVKLVANHLKVGFTMSNNGVKFEKGDIAAGIEKLMGDQEVRKRAKVVSKEFESGFPMSSVKALGDFVEFIGTKIT